MSGLIRKLDTPEDRAYWAHVDSVAQSVAERRGMSATDGMVEYCEFTAEQFVAMQNFIMHLREQRLAGHPVDLKGLIRVKVLRDPADPGRAAFVIDSEVQFGAGA
jgi:hypothetical protein